MSVTLLSNWIKPKKDFGTACPVFRKQFQIEKPVQQATLCITALGVYEAKLNNSRIGDFILAPGWTSYHKRIQTQEYDITAMLEDSNELRVTVGKGWCVGRLGWRNDSRFWNDTTALLARIMIEYKDGSRESIITDRDWQAAQSPVLFSEIYDGEIYDSTIIPSDWEDVDIYSYPKSAVIRSEGVSVKEMGVVRPVQLIKTPKGEDVIDFGQNLTGYVRFQVCGEKGATAELSHAEVLDSDGNFYTENLRSAKQKVTFICNGEKRKYHPHFTYQGFRYVRVDQWPEEIKLENFSAVVLHSDMKRTGYFECSNSKLNKLFQNILWTQKCNYIDVPTDCPQRDERLGWTGDARIFVRAASYNFDVERFYVKWLHDLKADQFEDGGVPAVIPNVLGEHHANSAGWGDAAVICPWQIYLTYGNRHILAEQIESMKKWVDYIRGQGDNAFLWDTGEHMGDWLGLDADDGKGKGATDQTLISTAFYAYSTSLLIKAGKVLGKDMAEYEKLYRGIVEAYQDRFIKHGKLTCNTQTAHVLTLYFNLCENKHALASNLADLIQANGNKLSTGLAGTPYLLHALSDNGYQELAYSLLLQEEEPSWLYAVNMGATTVWQNWNGVQPGGTLVNRQLNSFNHCAGGAVADWMYSVMGGIRIDENKPGFEHIIFQPVIDKRISFVNTSIEVDSGVVSSSWRRDNGKVIYQFEVPPHSKATILLGDLEYQVEAGRYSYKI